MAEPNTKKHKENVQKLQNFIDGKFVDNDNGQYIDDFNPATNQIIAHIPRGNAVDVDKAVKSAKAAFKTWSKTTAQERAALLNKLADTIEAKKEKFAKAESIDTGKPYTLALDLDVTRAAANFRFFASQVLHTSDDSHLAHPFLNYTCRKPCGVAALITPWNLPLYLLTWKVAPCIAFGNTCVAKPSEFTPLTCNLLAELFVEVNAPPGIFNVVQGTGPVTGAALVSHKDVALVSFTGGTETGKKIGVLAAESFKKVSLELGGKNSAVVFADCDFDATISDCIRSAFTNQGQICLCNSRMVVEQSIYDKFVDAFVEKAKKLIPGDPATANFGSLISLQHREKVESYIDLAQKEGGKIVLGGKRPDLEPPFDKGAFLLPTVVTGLSADSRCASEEVFGPFVTIHPFKTEEEALEIANNTQYGLAGSLFTKDVKRAHRFVHEWDTGMVWVNCWLVRDLRVPFGGVKQSGSGPKEGGRYCVDFWTESSNICLSL